MPQEVELKIESLAAGALGVARLDDGRVALVEGALPGELVLARLRPKTKGALFAEPLEILRRAPERVEPDCPFCPPCGGCDFLMADPEKALAMKAGAALSGLARLAGLTPELVESPRRTHYRRRVTLHLDRLGAGYSVGFYDRARKLAAFENCRLMDEDFAPLIKALREWAAMIRFDVPALETSLFKGEGESGFLVTLSPAAAGEFRHGRRPAAPHFPKELAPGLPRLRNLLAAAAAPAPLSLFYQAQAGARPIQVGPGPKLALAADWPDWDLKLWAGPGVFTQVNPWVNRLLAEALLAAAGPLAPGAALDLYSGLGNFALPLLRHGFAPVTAVEDNRLAAALARRSALAFDKNFIQIESQCRPAVDNLARSGRNFKLIVLDPPRAGARDLASGLAALKPEMISCISCHPATLERDFPAFLSLGFTPKKLMALDMFPRTSHLETLLVMSR